MDYVRVGIIKRVRELSATLFILLDGHNDWDGIDRLESSFCSILRCTCLNEEQSLTKNDLIEILKKIKALIQDINIAQIKTGLDFNECLKVVNALHALEYEIQLRIYTYA